jgi:hypothetical protein
VVKTRPPVPIYPALSSALSEQVAGVLDGSLSPADAVKRAGGTVMAEYQRQIAR